MYLSSHSLFFSNILKPTFIVYFDICKALSELKQTVSYKQTFSRGLKFYLIGVCDRLVQIYLTATLIWYNWDVTFQMCAFLLNSSLFLKHVFAKTLIAKISGFTVIWNIMHNATCVCLLAIFMSRDLFLKRDLSISHISVSWRL